MIAGPSFEVRRSRQIDAVAAQVEDGDGGAGGPVYDPVLDIPGPARAVCFRVGGRRSRLPVLTK
jgi:hypothetical protein